MNAQRYTIFGFLLLLSCSGADRPNSPNGVNVADVDAGANVAPGDAATTDGVETIPSAAECVSSPVEWSAGTDAFIDSTAKAGFEALGVNGVRMSGADIDGDGDLDLLVRRTGSTPNDFAEGGTRTVWLLRNDGGTFTDVTRESGIAASRFTGSDTLGRPIDVAVWGDVDNDGDVDAFTGFSNDGSIADGMELMLNDGTGKFEFGPITAFSGGTGPTSVGGATFMDIDRDGRLDLWLTRGIVDGAPAQDELYLQTGDLEFTNATADYGLTTKSWQSRDDLNGALAHTNSWGATACDLNGDGTPELMSASYGRAPNHLWLSSGEGFENASVASGYAFDHRQDWTDNQSARCHCQLNPEAAECEGVPAPTLIRCETQSDVFRWNHANDREPFRLGGNSGTTVCGDFDNDGDLDLLTSEIVHWDVGENSDPSEVLFNDGTGVFERPGNEATGLTRTQEVASWNDGDITAGVLDFDNDGFLDIYRGSSDYPGTRGHLYHNDSDGTFTKVPLSDGIDFTSSHGVVVADFDGDGDQDIVAGHSRFRCSSGEHCYPSGHPRFFENVLGESSNWLQIELQGADGTNSSAIGARITVTTDSGTQTREIQGGFGHYGLQDDLVQHFGLGAACEAEVEVRWPNGDLTTTQYRIGANQRVTLVAE